MSYTSMQRHLWSSYSYIHCLVLYDLLTASVPPFFPEEINDRDRHPWRSFLLVSIVDDTKPQRTPHKYSQNTCLRTPWGWQSHISSSTHCAFKLFSSTIISPSCSRLAAGLITVLHHCTVLKIATWPMNPRQNLLKLRAKPVGRCPIWYDFNPCDHPCAAFQIVAKKGIFGQLHFSLVWNRSDPLYRLLWFKPL